MKQIELTNEQAKELNGVWEANCGNSLQCYLAVLSHAVTMGLVRPASDDHAAHLKELWESIEGRIKAHGDLAARVAALEVEKTMLWNVVGRLHKEAFPKSESMYVGPTATPDPHAAARDRAKLWGVELVTLKDGTCLFMTEKHYLSNPNPSWYPHVFSFRSPHYSGGQENPSKAWSNFPTEPPPGWEATKPRTEGDRLGEVLASTAPFPWYFPKWENMSEVEKDKCRRWSLAVRKAVLAAQLEPSEEERDAALSAWNADSGNDKTAMRAALRAAARVRLEKAEGENK